MERTPAAPVYGLDIETDTSVDGLDPRVGRILAVAVAGPASTMVFGDQDEARLLDRLDFHLAGLEPGILTTWNGAKFDLPYLADRAEGHGLALGLRLSLDPAIVLGRPPLAGHQGAYRAAWHGHAHLDAYRLYRSDVVPALRISGSLKSVARVCGLEPVVVDAAQVHTLTRPHLVAYVASDAVCTRELAVRRWPAARGAIDRLPRALPGHLAGAVSPALLRARASAVPAHPSPDELPAGTARLDDVAVPQEALR